MPLKKKNKKRGGKHREGVRRKDILLSDKKKNQFTHLSVRPGEGDVLCTVLVFRSPVSLEAASQPSSFPWEKRF